MRRTQILRPVYGKHFAVRPKHWWNPRQRKAARLAARMADYRADAIYAQVREAMRRHMLGEG